jgi:TM2 domain-containing membrane protein YozV
MKTRHFRKNQIALFITFLSLSLISFPQSQKVCDLKFINHLVNTASYDEALFLLNSQECISYQNNDSINYLRGWCLYSLKNLKSSSENLLKVTVASSFYLKSRFFAAYNYAHTGLYENSRDILTNTEVNSEKMNSLKNFEIAGVYLLQGDYKMFELSLGKANTEQFEISESSDKLRKISTEMVNHKRKSPVIAGLLSGIIPGSGKFYAGKKGDAIFRLIATTGMGIVTWENYRKSGLNSFRTIAFGTAFAFSYVANIYGSVLTVNLLETEYRENVKNTILFNLHIPLRYSFDK